VSAVPYTIEAVRVTPAGNVVYSVARNDLQRVSVVVRRRFASGALADTIITETLAHLRVPTKPF
jgi:hypothetical protein